MPLTVGLVRVSGVPSLNSCASTVSNETSDATIAELSIKVQVKVTPVPTITMSELLLLVSMSEEGGGTTYNNYHYEHAALVGVHFSINTHFES